MCVHRPGVCVGGAGARADARLRADSDRESTPFNVPGASMRRVSRGCGSGKRTGKRFHSVAVRRPREAGLHTRYTDACGKYTAGALEIVDNGE